MSAQQRMKLANEKASKNIMQRGNVVKATVSLNLAHWAQAAINMRAPRGKTLTLRIPLREVQTATVSIALDRVVRLG